MAAVASGPTLPGAGQGKAARRRRVGSLCAIEVEGRPPMWAAYALSLGFRV